MDRDDWDELFAYLRLCVEAQKVIGEALRKGKEQVSVKNVHISKFGRVVVGPELLIQLGRLAGTKGKGES